MTAKTTIKVDPARIVDLTKCYAIMGFGDGRVGFQCQKKPAGRQFFCKEHQKLGKQVTGKLRRDLTTIRSAVGHLKAARAQEARRNRSLTR